MKFSSKNCGNVYNVTNNIFINGDDVTKNIVKILFAVAIIIAFLAISFVIAYRLLTVSDSVFFSILEKWLEKLFSGIEMLH